MAFVKDLMTTTIFTLSPESTVEEAIHTLLDRRISGAPVVDDHGQLVGVVSEFALLEIIYDPAIGKTQIADVMTRDVLTVRDDSLISDAVNLFIQNRIRRLPVVCDEQVVGVLSRRDILRYATRTAGTAEGIICTAASYCTRLSGSAEEAESSDF